MKDRIKIGDFELGQRRRQQHSFGSEGEMGGSWLFHHRLSLLTKRVTQAQLMLRHNENNTEERRAALEFVIFV